MPILPAKVVRLEPGTTITRPLIGFTPLAYEELRAEMAIGEKLLVVRSGDLAVVRGQLRLDSVDLNRRSQEIQRLRQVVAGSDAKLTAQEMRLDKVLTRPLQRPLLLDPHTLLGVLVGAVVGTVLVITR